MPKYLFAVLPPHTISDEIINYQKEIEVCFGSVHAQKAPPHITVIPPFNCEEEKLTQFIDKTTLFLIDKSINNVVLSLSGFQRFESRTLFVDVAKNELFETFCKELKLLFNQEKIINQRVEKHYFVPHITIANKDITKRNFKLAWESFKERSYERSFTLNQLHVLELKDEGWKLVESMVI